MRIATYVLIFLNKFNLDIYIGGANWSFGPIALSQCGSVLSLFLLRLASGFAWAGLSKDFCKAGRIVFEHVAGVFDPILFF